MFSSYQWKGLQADHKLNPKASSRALCKVQKIKATENVHKKYQKQLLAEKVVKEDDLKRMQEHVSNIMSKEFEAARDYKPEVCSSESQYKPMMYGPAYSIVSKQGSAGLWPLSSPASPPCEQCEIFWCL